MQILDCEKINICILQFLPRCQLDYWLEQSANDEDRKFACLVARTLREMSVETYHAYMSSKHRDVFFWIRSITGEINVTQQFVCRLNMYDLPHVLPFLDPSQYLKCVVYLLKSYPQSKDVFACIWDLLSHGEKKLSFEHFCVVGEKAAARYAWRWFKKNIPKTTIIPVTLRTPVSLLKMINTQFNFGLMTNANDHTGIALKKTIHYLSQLKTFEGANDKEYFKDAMQRDHHPYHLEVALGTNSDVWIQDALEHVPIIGSNALQFVLDRAPLLFKANHLDKLTHDAITNDVSVLDRILTCTEITPQQIATYLSFNGEVVWTWLLRTMPRDDLRLCIRERIAKCKSECGEWFQHERFWLGDDPLLTIPMMLEHSLWNNNLLMWDFLVKQNCFVDYPWRNDDMEILLLNNNSKMLEYAWQPTEMWLSKYQQHIQFACMHEASIALEVLLGKKIPFDATPVLEYLPILLRCCRVDAFSNLEGVQHAKLTLRTIINAHRDNDLSDNCIQHRNATRKFIWSLRPLTQAEICKIFCYLCPDTQFFMWKQNIVTADNLCQKNIKTRIYAPAHEYSCGVSECGGPIPEPCCIKEDKHVKCVRFHSNSYMTQFLKRIHFDLDFKHHTFLSRHQLKTK